MPLPDGFKKVAPPNNAIGSWLCLRGNVLEGRILDRKVTPRQDGDRVQYLIRVSARCAVRTWDGGDSAAQPGDVVALDERAALEGLAQNIGADLYLEPLRKVDTGRTDREGKAIERWEFDVGVRPASR